jgi:hypothetical protein
MAARPSIILVLMAALGSLGASYRTQNFMVEAATPAIAKQIGDYAEHYRKEKALQWLGHEMPPWPQPCPLRATVTMNGSGGATSFAFDHGRILSQDMRIEGTLERLLNSVLPHEITHTVFAHYFRTPVPRWSDEGGSVLSEDDIERHRHDQLVRQILNTPGRRIPLRRLFNLTQYPPDVMVLYAEGFSVTQFLVGRSNRQAFLTFVAHGMRGDWDGAARTHYGYRSVEDLEGAWIQSLRENRRPEAQVASGGRPTPTEGTPTSRVLVRQTYPPAQPLLGAPQPIYRGAPPEEEALPPTPGAPLPERRPFAAPSAAPASTYPVIPEVPVRPVSGTAAPVRLGAPQFDEMPRPTATLGRPYAAAGTGSPVGYSP